MIGRRSALLGVAGALVTPLAAPFAAGAKARVPLAAEPISRMSTGWWKRRHEAKLAEIKGRQFDLVWLGDSITQNWERQGPPAWQAYRPVWDKFYGDRRALNLGFKGDATSHLLWRMMNGELAGLSPKVAVILIGANNMGRVHWPVADNIAGVQAVVTEARKRIPQAGLLLLGVLPSARSAWVSESTLALNKGLATEYANGRRERVAYMDVGRVLYDHGTVESGRLDASLFLDPHLTPPEPLLHPSPEGMGRIAEAIEPTLARMMGDAVHMG
jgi:lysophospholipase L1-like esterase